MRQQETQKLSLSKHRTRKIYHQNHRKQLLQLGLHLEVECLPAWYLSNSKAQGLMALKRRMEMDQ